jgi:hypothetical protein
VALLFLTACSEGGPSSGSLTGLAMLHGSKIVFYVEPATTTRHGATYAINSDGGGKTRIRVGSFATLSPDGSKTVYDRSPRNADLYVANLDGSA